LQKKKHFLLEKLVACLVKYHAGPLGLHRHAFFTSQEKCDLMIVLLGVSNCRDSEREDHPKILNNFRIIL